MPANGSSVHEGMSDSLRRDVQPLLEGLSWIAKYATLSVHRHWAVDQLVWLADSQTAEARFDSLTQLPNRTGLEILFDDLVKEMSCPHDGRRDTPVALILLSIDVEKFKFINERVGFIKASDLLATIARLIESCLRRGDIAARPGGDEFVVLVPVQREQLLDKEGNPVTYQQLAEDIQGRLRRACQEYSNRKDRVAKIALHCRYLIVSASEGDLTLRRLMERADPKHSDRYLS